MTSLHALSLKFAFSPLEIRLHLCRQNGMGLNSAVSRSAVAITPLILMLDDVWESMPKVIFSSLAVLGSVVAWTLPETCDRCLPETIDEVENRRSGLELSPPSKECLTN